MAGYVRLRGFRASTDPNATGTETGRKSPQDDDTVFEGRFRATRVWNGMLKRFRSGMPVKRHRRQLRFFDDCFLGREAVDFLMNELPKFIHDGREITRTNCSKLLGKYLEIGLFCPVRGKLDDSEPFKESELYRFSSFSLERLATTPILVRRAASFNERYSFGNGQPKDNGFGFTALHRIHTPGWRNRNKEGMVPARMAIPAMKPNAPLSRRLSASHGNLPSMMSSRHLDNVPTERLTIRGVLKTTTPSWESDGVATENVENRPGTSKQTNALDEVIAELAKVNTGNPTDISNAQNLRHFGKVIQVHSPEDSAAPKSPETVVNEKHSGTQLFLGVNEIYKNVLLDRLRSVLQIESLKGILKYDFNSADVRWNCEQVGAKGIVRVPPESDYLSNYVITMMRYLSRWPFDTKFADSTRVPYEGFELNVFKSVCEQFDKGCPMISNPVALSLLNIVRLFRQRAFHKRSPADLHKETVFCGGDSPVTRYVHRNPQKLTKANGSSSSSKTLSADRGYPIEEHGTSPPNMTRSSVSTLSADSDDLQGRMAYEAILTRLPGLQRSPELMQRIEELAKTNTLMPRSSTPRSCSSPFLSGISKENEKLLKEAISLVMLTLEPRVRRRLHYLLRFMLRVSRNYCLRLEQRHDNRSIVLESLPSKILLASEVISAADCRELVIFLMDNEGEVFAIPDAVVEEVKLQMSRQHEVTTEKTPVMQQTTEQPSSTERMKEHFCEPIGVEEYESQKNDAGGHLLSLLDGILTDENLSLSYRKQQLKKFKKNYPEIYARKFPSPGLPKTRFIDRIRSFHL